MAVRPRARPPSSSTAPVLYGRLPEILAVDFGREPGQKSSCNRDLKRRLHG